MTLANIVEFKGEDIEDIIRSRDIVVLDFWAPWCVPCNSINSLIERLARKCSNVLFVKINTDENPEIASRYGVKSVPSILIFIRGSIATRLHGILEANLVDRRLREVAGVC